MVKIKEKEANFLIKIGIAYGRSHPDVKSFTLSKRTEEMVGKILGGK